MTETSRAKTGRPLWWVAGLSLCLLVAVGLVAWAVVDDDPYVAPAPPAPTSTEIPPSLAAAALQDLEEAVADGDEEAARALAPAGDDDAADRLAGVVANAEAAGVEDFTLRFVDAEGTDGFADATWRFGGFDPAPAYAEVTVGLADEDDRVAITGFGGGDRVSPLWLSGPLEVRRSADSLVLVDGSDAEADAYADRADAAVPVVRAVLPAWKDGLVVEVPASVEDLDRVLDADAGTYDQIAAVTTSVDGQLGPDSPVHVFVNPDVYRGLADTGAQVVMSHEATHVATDAFTSSVPLWLLEGFADYVALRDVGLPLERSASQIIAEVRRDGPPGALPGEAEFGTRTADLGATYESAWLAARLLAEDGGEDRLVRFYDAVSDGTPVARALASEFGLSVRDLTEQWRDLLRDLAG
ncbi:gluzincin family metallopeptidase [Nocardioides pyridinolyticus]